MMRHGWLALCIAIMVTSTSFGDVIVEPFFVDDPFFNGTLSTGPPGTGPGDQLSVDNWFDTSPDITGSVFADNPLAIPAGFGDVILGAHFSGTLTQLDFDMGANLAASTLDSSFLIASSITMDGIEFDADADNFSLSISAMLLDGTVITDLSNLSISSTNTMVAATNLDGGTFQLDLTPTGGVGQLVFESSTSSPLRSINFGQIQPDVSGDLLTFSGNRTIGFTGVPEPSGVLLLMTTLGALALRRRRTP